MSSGKSFHDLLVHFSPDISIVIVGYKKMCQSKAFGLLSPTLIQFELTFLAFIDERGKFRPGKIFLFEFIGSLRFYPKPAVICSSKFKPIVSSTPINIIDPRDLYTNSSQIVYETW